MDYFKKVKLTKYIQLVFSILCDIVFFLVLSLVPSLKYGVYTNSGILILCIIMWTLCIGTLIFIIFDIRTMIRMELEQHELSKEIYLDEMTGIPNRHGLDVIFDSYEMPSKMSNVGCAILTINNLLDLNSTQGHIYGDKAIRDFCDILERIGDKYGFVARNGGNEYLAIIENCSADTMNSFISDLNESVSVRNETTTDPAIELSSAYILNSKFGASTMRDLISAAYRKLEENV